MASNGERPVASWRRLPDCPELVWHRFEDDDWVVHDPGLGTTHALGVLPATLLTLLESEPLTTHQLLLAVGDLGMAAQGELGDSPVGQALLELEARGLIERG